MRKRLVLTIVMIAICMTASAQAAKSTSQAGNAASAPTDSYPTIPMKESETHLVTRLKATYPAIASAAHVAGVVLVGAQVDTNGDVTQVIAISGPNMLKGAALEAVKQYKYRPFLVNGSPAIVRVGVAVKFVLGRSTSVE